MRVYSLLDRKLKQYGSLTLAHNDESVKRGVNDSIPGSQSVVEKYPDDFDVMFLGEFDQESGILLPAEVPVFVDNVAVILEAYAKPT